MTQNPAFLFLTVFRDQDKVVICIEDCSVDQLGCQSACDGNSTCIIGQRLKFVEFQLSPINFVEIMTDTTVPLKINLEKDCAEESVFCHDNCPCFANCPDGCTDCPAPVCQCDPRVDNGSRVPNLLIFKFSNFRLPCLRGSFSSDPQPLYYRLRPRRQQLLPTMFS